jgi:hypothetical protein
LKNHRRTGRESRGGPRVRFLGADTGRPSSDCSRIGTVTLGGSFRLIQMTMWSLENGFPQTRPQTSTSWQGVEVWSLRD